jgi:protoporphyrinogen oxidase
LSSERTNVVILGAGPAGLGAALQLARRGSFAVTVLERQQAVGGNAGSFELDGLRVDYGSHRLHPTCPPQVLADIHAMLGDDLLDRPRHGRIRLRGRWLHFPLKPANLAVKLPPGFVLGVMRDSVLKRGHGGSEETFTTVLERGLGRTICRDFYFPYAEKIWGLPPGELDAEQARRRVSAGSLKKLVRKVMNVVPGLKPKGAGRFFYPRQGFGQISDAYHRAALDAGATIKLGTPVSGVELEAGRAAAVLAGDGTEVVRLPARQILSTIPLPLLARVVRPVVAPEVLASAAAMKYRAMILIYLVLQTERFTEYDAHYFPEAAIPITRLSEPKNYSLTELPGTTVLCAELPCATEDQYWKASDDELGEVVKESLATARLPLRVPVRRVVARRLPHAYPIYTRDYRKHFDRLDRWVNGIDGVLTLGRQGLFAHDNTHHTLAMAYAASECLSPGGELDRARWAEYRRQFESHVVED